MFRKGLLVLEYKVLCIAVVEFSAKTVSFLQGLKPVSKLVSKLNRLNLKPKTKPEKIGNRY